jgi:NitT/TauT family transport system permease protein
VRRHLIDFALLLVGLLVLWQVLHELVGEYALTSPLETFRYAVHELGEAYFWNQAGASALALFYALLVAIFGGLALGLPLGLKRLPGDVAEPMLVTLFSIPKVTLYPVILLLFGLGLSAKVAFGAIHGIFPVAIFALNGIRKINPIYVKTSRSLNLSPMRTIFTVLLPAALPEIASGLRIGFAATILGTLIGEMFAATEGLGFMLIKAIDENNVALLMTLTLFLFLVAAAANGVLLVIDQRLHRRAMQPTG